MAYPGLAHEEHKYLGKEYCTGYTDVYGKWNTGFYCPQYGSKTAVFCCGTAVFKYCCTNQEPVDLTASGSGVLLEGDDPNFDGGPHPGVSSAVFVRVPIVFGVVCGIAAVLILLIVAGCYFCSCCFAYKKRRNDVMHPNPHHHLHLNHHPSLPSTGLYRSTTGTNSTASSNVLNLYSPAATGPLTNSLVTTPLDLDWASSIASTYQSQQQLYVPSQTLPGIHQFSSAGNPTLSPATAALAAALSTQQQRSNSVASSLLYNTTTSGGGNCSSGAPSVISTGITNSSGVGRLPYQTFMNTSTSTLSSTPVSRQHAPVAPSQLHRGNLPQQISTTASIVNSYLASLQQAQSQIPTHPPPPEPHVHHSQNTTSAAAVTPHPSLPPERTRHPSPPPSYFQTVSSSSYHNNGGNNNRSSQRSNVNSSGSRSGSRMSTIQSILGNNSGSSYYPSGNFNSSNEDDLLLADFLLRHENTLRRTLGLSNNNNNNNNRNSSTANTTTTNNNNSNNNNNSRNRGNPLLSQRELIDLLLRLTCNNNSHLLSSSSSISRSDSRAGSETNSTASSVATTRSTVSSSSSSNGALNHHHHSKNPSNTSSGNGTTKLTINEVDEDMDELHEVNSSTGTATTTSSLAPGPNSKASLDLTLSRLSVENDSGVASSGCSTAGSEHAEGLIGGIKVISRDLSEEALKLKKQHAVDDDVGDDDGGLKMKLCEQQLAATIHPETNCGSVVLPKSTSTPTAEGEVIVMESSDDQQTSINVESCLIPSTTSLCSNGSCSNNSTSSVIHTKSVVTVPVSNSGGIVPVHVVKTSENSNPLVSATAQV